MGDNSKIEWTDASWNPVTGCSKVSPGCKNCYAERLAARLKAMGTPAYRNGFEVTLQPQTLEKPLKWKKPRQIFVNSMSDLFHEAVPDSYIREVFDIMRQADWHTFQALTKRPERAAAMKGLEWPRNVWLGTSVENQEQAEIRIPHLLKAPAAVQFLSCEPLLGPLNLRKSTLPRQDGKPLWPCPCPESMLFAVDWVIVGGESGPNARPMHPDWARSIRDQCAEAGVAFFVKQMARREPIPADLMIRQYPEPPR